VFDAGATGGVGKRVVQTLLNKGKAVRALVRDEQKARKLLVGYKTCTCWLCGALVQQHKRIGDQQFVQTRVTSTFDLLPQYVL